MQTQYAASNINGWVVLRHGGLLRYVLEAGRE